MDRMNGRYQIAFRPDKFVEPEVRVCDGYMLFGSKLDAEGYTLESRVCDLFQAEIDSVIENKDRLELSMGPLIARKMHITVTDEKTGEIVEDVYNGLLFVGVTGVDFRAVRWRFIDEEVEECMAYLKGLGNEAKGGV